MVKVKKADDIPTKNFQLFQKDLPEVKSVQLVHHLSREKTFPNGTEIRKVGNSAKSLSLYMLFFK